MAHTYLKLENEHEHIISGAKYYFNVKKKGDAIKKIIEHFNIEMKSKGWKNNGNN